MITIKIADVVIGIENKYEYICCLCEDYYEENAAPEFIVSISGEEILQEQKKSPAPCSLPYAESQCIFRKICRQFIEYDAFVMHSAVIAVDSEAYVFAAKSGTGKTTHMKLWMERFKERARVVNGDKPIFRFRNETLYACGTPWRGKEGLGSNIMCPVKAVCFLEQSLKNDIHPMDEGEVVEQIFHQLLMPQEEEALDRFMSLVERMLGRIRFYYLRCNMESTAAELAYGTMRRGVL